MAHANRRQILRTLGAAGATLGLGCRTKQPAPASPAVRLDAPDASPASEADAALVATPSCDDTEHSILGPYWRDGAPMRSNLEDPLTMKGTRFALSGRVRAAGCKLVLAGATLDFWQADAEGAYDDGIWPPPKTLFRLRGRVVTDAEGRYTLATIIPGHYLNGAQYRPAHLHVIAQASGYAKLTTQLYFDGDPYNGIDPFIKTSLIMKLANQPTGKSGTFDFVLAPS